MKNKLERFKCSTNFIAHDYDSVDDEVLETVLRVHLPKIKEKIEKILS